MNDDAKRLAGKREEDRVYEAVSELPGVKVYRNLYVPYERAGQTAELDLVLLCNKGIFTIEVKSFSKSLVVGSQVRWEWTQHYRCKTSGAKAKRKFLNPLRQVDQQISVLARYLGTPPKQIGGLVCFSDKATLKVPARSDSGIAVLQTRFVASHIRRSLANRKPCFSPTELRRIAQRLDAATNASAAVKRRHILQAHHAERVRNAEQEHRRKSRKRR